MKFKLSILFAMLFAPILAPAADFELKGYGVHTAAGVMPFTAVEMGPLAGVTQPIPGVTQPIAGVTYHYTFVNNTASTLADPWRAHRVVIGLSARWRDGGKPELIGLPPILLPPPGSPPVYMGNGILSMTAPTGWRGFESGEQEHVNHTLVWEVESDANDNYIWAAALLPGQTLTGLSVTRLGDRDGYLNGSFIVSAGPKDFIGRVQKQDTLPPVLSVTLSPSTLKPNEKLIPITATLTVKDDYDPVPEIKLESITANEPLEREDIKDAQIGTDDRQFKLKAEREGKNKAGRIYTVTYSATDGSGNKAIASATVTVPHDERKDRDDEKNKSR